MAEYIIMPKLGFNMDTGKIVKWLKNEGDIVKEREPILRIETDKAVIDVEASIGGILRKIFLGEDSEVPVTLPIGIIGEENEDIENMVQEAQQKLSSIKEDKQEKKVGTKIERVNINGKSESIGRQTRKEEVKISPRAKKLANQLEIDLYQLKEFKEQGVIREDDVRKFLSQLEGVKKKGLKEEKIPYTGIRKIIGDRLSQSKFTAPHIYFTSSVDMQKSLEALEKINLDSQVKITINDLIVFFVARVLEKNNDINVSLVDDQIVYHDQINLGIAVAIEDGLIVPVVKEANKKNIYDLSIEIKELVHLARQRKLSPQSYEGGTFSISNLGMYGIDQFTAIINPPEAAILAVGKINRMPRVVNESGIEKIIIHSVVKLTLSVDHRLIDGAVASKFLSKLKNALELPDEEGYL